MIPENFKAWACSLSGCDGGNLDAETWLCGIEWGGGSYGEGVYYKTKLPKEIEKGKFIPKEKNYIWKDHITYAYGRSFAKLYAAIHGERVADYKHLIENKWKGTEILKLNLYPIAFDSTDEKLWHDNRLGDITGFDEKHLFQTWCFMNRFPAFSRLREQKKPKLIICTGISYLRDFFVCFGGNQNNSGLIKSGDIVPISKTNSQNKRRYYWVNIDEYTTLIVIPFFSGIYGLNSDYLLQKMGCRIQMLCS